MDAAKQLAPPATLIAAVLVAIFGPKLDGVQTSTVATYVAAAIGALLAAHHAPKAKKAVKKVAPKRHRSGLVTMWDAVTVGNVPRGVKAFLAYPDGRFANVAGARQRFKKAQIYEIATSFEYATTHRVDFIDVESGDMIPSQVPAVMRAQRDKFKNDRLGVYGSLSTWSAIRAALRADNIPLTAPIKFVANPTNPPRPHIPPGFDGCQYEFAGGFDKSLFHAGGLPER